MDSLIKKCTKCSTEKDTTEFFGNKRTKDGLASWCKDCTKAASKALTAKVNYRREDGKFLFKGRGGIGHDNRNSKLTEEKVLQIRSEHRAGNVSMASLARRHNVTIPTISAILTRRTWKHI